MQRKTEKNKRIISVTTVIRECFNIIKNTDRKILSAVMAAMMLVASCGFVTKYYTFGYNVYYGDVNVGVSSSKEEAIEAYEEAATDVKERSLDSLDMDLSFTMTIASVDEIVDSDIYRGIVQAAQGSIDCYAIEADGVCVAKLRTIEEAQKAVSDYAMSFGREDAMVQSSYTVANSKGIVTEIVTTEEAVELIADSKLFKICYRDLAEEEILLDYTKSVIEDETIPEGNSVVKQQGRAGKGMKRSITYYENGVVTHTVEPSIEVVEEPVEEIVCVGTGKMAGLCENSLDFPAEGRFTSDYGRRWGRNHNGIDIAANPGTPIYAPAMGTVTFSGKKSGYGNYIMIDHGNGYVTTYAHMTDRYVSEGDVVSKGDLIGTVGSTGRVTGPHLHFEILINASYVDPMKYIVG